MRDICKKFPGIVANENIDFELQAGEIHALLGENGAGKTTLMNVLTGLYRPDRGEITFEGRPVSFRSPRDALDIGIGMVHQHFRLIPSFTVAENIILGLKSGQFSIRMSSVEDEVARLSEKYGIKVDPRRRIQELSIGEQQRVEILKLLYRKVKVVILDEPTSVLTPQEADNLFAILEEMAREGKGIVFISHKLHEVMRISDRITILRGGRRVATLARGDANERELARLMVGHEVPNDTQRSGDSTGRPVLVVSRVSALGYVGLTTLKEVSFEVREGEIFSVLGVAGNGQRELAEVITGNRRVVGGSIKLDGEEIGGLPARKVIERGVAFVPEDRVGLGLLPGLSACDNLLLKCYQQRGFSKQPKFLLDRGAARKHAEGVVKRFRVKIPNVDTPIGLMSGGNLQRLLLGREIALNPRLLVAAYPFRGLDVQATRDVEEALFELTKKKSAVLLIMEDIDEALRISDRVAVMYEGRIVGTLERSSITREEIGYMMAGGKTLDKGH